ncbi:MAG: DUF3801 domain-containing protein [Clostridium sp.]|nr:DUF3801 domain-containing protein [Clostridium sp.]
MAQKMTGALVFDERTDRYDIRFDLNSYYGGLHCGECFDVFVRGKWKPTRIEYGDNAGVSNIEITEGNIKAFESTAKKYGIDFALKKDATESPPRYLVFFKGRDADVLTAAFKEFSAKKLTQEKKPSIRKLLSTLKEAAQGRNAERAKVKNKDREVSL